MRFLKGIKKEILLFAHNQERLYIFFCAVLMVTNLCLFFTERMNWPARVAFICIPLATQMLLLAASRKPGIFFLILFPKIILDAFQLVLLNLYGNSIIAVDMFLNLVTTSATEAGELLGSIAPVIIFMIVIYIPAIIFAVVSAREKRVINRSFRKKALTGASALLALGILFLFIAKTRPDGFTVKYDLYPNNVFYNLDYAVKKWHRINNYTKSSQGFTYQASRCDTTAKREREIYVLVIGETSRADNWSLYGYSRTTTPMLDTLAGLLKFEDVLSQSNTTHKSVPMLLTPASAEEYRLIYNCKSIVTLFKEAGFKTAYLTNHEYHHTFMAHYFKEADIAVSVKDNAGNSHDSLMLKPLETILDTVEADLFVVVHLYGSHFEYSQRYSRKDAFYKPDIAERIAKKYKQQLVNAYDNSILSTDRILYRIVEMVRRQECASALIYTSDHGEDIFDDRRNRFLHASPIPTFYQIHVPFVAWSSPRYRELYGQKWQNMTGNTTQPLSSNSAVFHTLTDLASIKTKYLKSELSLCSENFRAVPRTYLTDHEESVRIDQLLLSKYDYQQFEEKNIRLH